MTVPGTVTVVGSANLDIVVPVPHHPTTGETVLGGDHAMHPGGKGANQAVAAARAGASVSFVGRIGADDAGGRLRASLEAAGVDTTHLAVDAGAPSGIACIGVDADGDNAIVVSPGANGRVGAADVAAAGPLLTSAAVTLLQLETPVDVVVDAATRAAGVVVVNPAPVAPLPDDLLTAVDVLVPNRIELAQLAGTGVPVDLDEVAGMARGLGLPAVVVTLGADGALVCGPTADVHVPAPAVTAVDTTACGDAFCGALADALARGVPLVDAAARAVHAGALTATRAGAQPSLPSAAEIDASMAR